MHVLIVGTTGSGKTTLATQLVRSYAARGVHSIVLDPMMDRRWRAGTKWVTDDPATFQKWVGESRRCMVFIDESGEMVGQYRSEMFWLATRARHLGHLSHFLTQRPAQLSRTVRGQCSTLYAFAMSIPDAKSLADEWGRTPEARTALLEAGELQPGEFLKVPRFGAITRHRLDLSA